jgi:hypothetical protein
MRIKISIDGTNPGELLEVCMPGKSRPVPVMLGEAAYINVPPGSILDVGLAVNTIEQELEGLRAEMQISIEKYTAATLRLAKLEGREAIKP